MPKDPEKDWIKKHIARLNIPTVPEIAPRDNTRVRKTGRAALAEAARLVSTGGRSIGPADPTATPAPETTVQSQYRPRYDKAIKGAASFLPPVFGFEGGKETAHQVNAGNYAGAAATAALTLLTPEDAGAIGRKLTGKALPKIARAAIKLPDGSIHWGRSHAAAIDAAIRDGAITRKSMTSILEKSQDGFVDAKGNFLTRAETADRIRALGVKLPKDMRDGNFTSEELLGIPSIRRKAMMEPGSLPHQGMRSFDESFPSVGEVQVRAKGARKGKKSTPAAVADSVLNVAARQPVFEYGPNAAAMRDAEALRGDPHLYTAAGPIKFRPEPHTQLPKNYAVLTAENPKGTPASAAENAAHSERLKNRLTQLGYKFEPTNGGGYFDEESKKWLTENPLLIHDITGPEAEQLAREFNQNSVLTNHGLHDIANNKLVPSSGVKYAEGNDAYTDFGAKGRISSVLDWSDEAAKPLMQPPAFYSRLERAIQGGQNKATPAQWLAQLSKNVNSDERLWTGVDAFLKGADPKTPISRDDVLGVFNKGKINLSRKTLADRPDFNRLLTERAPEQERLNTMEGEALMRFRALGVPEYEALNAVRRAWTSGIDIPDIIHRHGLPATPETEAALEGLREQGRRVARLDEAIMSARNAAGPERAKFAQYTEPGGTNYRENLTILQDPKLDANKAYEARMYELSDRLRSLEDGFGNPLPGREREARNVRRQIDAIQNGSANLAPQGFRSNHWSDPNVLMHTRDKTRTLPDGGKVLHAEELQSDWHQQGREKGYDTPEHAAARASHTDALAAAERRTIVARQNIRHMLAQAYPGAPNDNLFFRTTRQLRDAIEEGGDALKNYREENSWIPDEVVSYMQNEMLPGDAEFDRLSNLDMKRGNPVPDAPFKKTDDWQLLGLKQLIDDAVRGGYDRIAWTPGDMQADRYSLRKLADRIDYHPSRGELNVWNGRELVHNGTYDPKALPSVIGKDAAANLLGGTPHPSGMLSLEGEGLDVGGEGMRQFYDRMLPKNLNSYFKQLGLPPAEIEQVPLSMAPVQGYETLTNADGLTSKRPIMGDVPTIPSFPVSPPLWRQVVNNGQPLMSLMGALGLGATGLAAAREKQQF